MKPSVCHVFAAALVAFATSIGCIVEATDEQTDGIGSDEEVGIAALASCTPSQTCSAWQITEYKTCCANHRRPRQYMRSCTEVTYGCEIRQWSEGKTLCDGSTCTP